MPKVTRPVVWHFVLALTCLLASGRAGADDSLDTSLRASPLMSAEQCAAGPPEELRGRIRAAGIETDCQACADAFYEVYAERLRPLVDRQYPNVVALRKPLTDAVSELDRFLAGVTDGNWFGHETSRIPSRVEWMLLEIGRGKFRAVVGEARYQTADIERLAITFARANVDGEPAEIDRRIDSELRPILRSALESLEQVTKQVDVATARELRRVMMRRIGAFL